MTTYPQTSDPVNALTRADGTTELHSVDHGRVIGVWENVKHHGAVGDGTTDDTTKIQAAVDALSTKGGTLFFPQGTYKITSSITLPSTASSPAGATRWRVMGHGATLKATTGVTMLKSATPASNNAASTQSNCQYTIEGLSFFGNNTTGQRAIQLLATYGSVVRDCAFRALDYGIDCIFAINTRIEECFFSDMTTTDIMVRSATYGPNAPIWGGASNDFTASNNCYILNCRHYQGLGQTRTVDIGGTAQCVIDGCVYEGAVPLVSVHYDDNGSVNSRTFTMRNCWFESAGGAGYTCIELPAFLEARLERIRFAPGTNSTHISCQGVSTGILNMSDCEFLSVQPKINQAVAGVPHWVVHNQTAYSDLFTNAAYWVTAQPTYFTQFVQANGNTTVEGTKIILRSTADYVYAQSDAAGTPQSLSAANVVVNGVLRLANTAAATTPGSVVKKLPVYTEAGVFLGYVPIYDAIT